MMCIPRQAIVHPKHQGNDHQHHSQQITNQELTAKFTKEFLCFHSRYPYFAHKVSANRAKNQNKVTKKTERSKDSPLLLSVLTIFPQKTRFTFRDSRQKLLTSCDPLHDVQPERGGHSWWPFSHGSRAC
jgi:hypothetical protein